MKTNILLFFIGLLLLVSCKPNNKSQDCVKCKLAPPHQILSLKVGNVDKVFKIWTGAGEGINDNEYSLGMETTPSDRNELLGILSYYHIDVAAILKSDDLVSIVLYSSGGLKDSFLNESTIEGAAVYTTSDDKMYINTFKKVSGRFQLLTELSSDVRYVSSNDFYSLSFIFKRNPDIVAWNLTDRKFTGIKKKSRRNFQHNLDKFLNLGYLNKKDGFSTLGIDQMEHYQPICDYPCIKGTKGICYDVEGPVCIDEKPMCAYSAMQKYNTYTEAADPRLSTLYHFRDDILESNAVGQHLKNDFYYCGDIISGNITQKQATDGYHLIDNRILPILLRLLSTSAAADSSVIYSSGVGDEIIAYVSDMKTLSADTTYNEILEEVKGNVAYCAGKTVAQIKYELTH